LSDQYGVDNGNYQLSYLGFSYERLSVNVVDPRSGSYTNKDYSKELGPNSLILKFGADHFNRYSYSNDGEIEDTKLIM
jgi:hypothetical protein